MEDDNVNFYSAYNDICEPGLPTALQETLGGTHYLYNSSRGMQKQVIRNTPWLEVRVPDRNNWSFRQPPWRSRRRPAS